MRASLARFHRHSFGKFAPAWATLAPIEAKARDIAMKILKTALVLVAVIAIGGALGAWFWFQGQREPFTGAALERDLALQDESAVVIPPQRLERLSDAAPQPNANRNLYFGELHLHTDQSFDAVLFGNRLTIDDAYRFARGEKLVSGGLEVMQLSRPLDFVAITDHAEGFGSRRHCGQSGLPLKLQLNCWVSRTPNMATFKFLRKSGNGGTTKLERANSPYCRAVGVEQCIADAKADWADFMALADRHNEPGAFTTIKAYEYSPTLPDFGKYHRNVFFRGNQLPELAVSVWDAPTELDLWRALEQGCTGDCEFLTIPHNTNRAWGLPYGTTTRYGDPYTPADWALRARYEPHHRNLPDQGCQRVRPRRHCHGRGVRLRAGIYALPTGPGNRLRLCHRLCPRGPENRPAAGTQKRREPVPHRLRRRHRLPQRQPGGYRGVGFSRRVGGDQRHRHPAPGTPRARRAGRTAPS